MKPESAENWIDYFLNEENNTPTDVPEGDLTQWTSWWDNLKSGNPQRPPKTTMGAIKEQPVSYSFPARVPMEIKPKKNPFIKEKKKEPASSEMWF